MYYYNQIHNYHLNLPITNCYLTPNSNGHRVNYSHKTLVQDTYLVDCLINYMVDCYFRSQSLANICFLVLDTWTFSIRYYSSTHLIICV